MTQPDAKLQTKWEKRLKKAGLGIVQPMTDNSDGEMGEVPLKPHANSRVLNHAAAGEQHRIDMARLRNTVDGSEGFMEGHQITKVATKERVVPEWAMSNKEVQRILLMAFPKLATNPRQRKSAAIYTRIIYLYWRMKLPVTIVGREMGMDKVTLDRKIQILNRLAKGLTPSGTPRKRGVSQPTPCEGTTEGRHETVQSSLLHRAGNGSDGEDGTP